MTEEQKRIVNDFTEYEKIKGSSDRWLNVIPHRLKPFFQFLEETEFSLYEINVKKAYDFQGYLLNKENTKGRKYQTGSVMALIIVASCLYDYLVNLSIVETNPFREIRRPKRTRKIPRNILKEKQINYLFQELSKWDKKKGNLSRQISRYRVHVISELIYSTGLKISEVAALNVDNIDFARGLITVSDGKQDKKRVCLLNDYTAGILKLYVDEMREITFNCYNKVNSNSLFGIGWGWLEKVVNHELKDVSQELGYGGFTSQGIRHSLGYHLLRSGCDIRYIKEILGHEQLKTTEIYTMVDKEDLKEVFEKYHPRQFKKRSTE